MQGQRFKTEEDVYRNLGRVLGRAPNETVWRLLMDEGRPGEVIDPFEPAGSEAAFDELVDKYRRTERILSESGTLNGRRRVVAPTEQAGSVRSTDALAALSAIMAVEAQSHPLVVAFRERVLGGTRLHPEEVEPWCLAHDLAHEFGAEGGAGRLTFPRPPGSWPTHGARENAWEAQVDAERYADGDLDVEGHETDFGLCVVEVLIDVYGWTEWSEVVRFVLSGEPPRLISAICLMLPRERFFPKSASVHLIVNPLMEPRRLMDFYATMRRTYMAPNTRIRPPGAAASRLAVFVARHNDGSTWQDVWAAWNAEGGRQYADVRSFARDARKAYRMVTGEELEWIAGKDNGPSRESGQDRSTNDRGQHEDD